MTAITPIAAALQAPRRLNAEVAGCTEWTPATITVASASGGVIVKSPVAGTCKGFFAVHPALTGNCDCGAYALTHLPTGLALTFGDDSQSLRELGDILADLGDWSAEAVFGGPVIAKARPIVRAFNGQPVGVA